MEYTQIPNTDLKPSAICLGIGSIGVKNTEAEGMALLDAFVEQGGTFIDTARVYSNWVPGEVNRSERILGDWLATRKNRDHIIIGTKCGHPDLSTMHISRLSKADIEEDANGSLEKLQTDTIDLFYLHRDDPTLPVSGILDTLHDLQTAGKIRHYACSNWTPNRIREANTYAREKGYTGFVANQMRWNIGCFQMRPSKDTTMCAMNRETQTFHEQTGLAAIPYSSQAGGFFSKCSDNPESVTKSAYNTDANQKLHAYLQSLTKPLNLTISQIILAYFWSHTFTAIPIVGCRNRAQLNDSLSAVGHQLPDEVMHHTNQLNGL